MKIYFTDKKDDVWFEYSEVLPEKNICLSSSASNVRKIKNIQELNERMKSYFAYQKNGISKTSIGFIIFTDRHVNGKFNVYVIQSDVANKSLGIGRRLMECVLSHYPANTEFYILTCNLTEEAKLLYQDRLHFTPISEEEIRSLGYGQHYCGLKHMTNVNEICAIHEKQLIENKITKNKVYLLSA